MKYVVGSVVNSTGMDWVISRGSCILVPLWIFFLMYAKYSCLDIENCSTLHSCQKWDGTLHYLSEKSLQSGSLEHGLGLS